MFLLCHETKSLVTPHPGSSSTYLGVCALVKLKSERFLSVRMALDSPLSDSKQCCLGCFCLVWTSEGRRQDRAAEGILSRGCHPQSGTVRITMCTGGTLGKQNPNEGQSWAGVSSACCPLPPPSSSSPSPRGFPIPTCLTYTHPHRTHPGLVTLTRLWVLMPRVPIFQAKTCVPEPWRLFCMQIINIRKVAELTPQKIRRSQKIVGRESRRATRGSAAPPGSDPALGTVAAVPALLR